MDIQVELERLRKADDARLRGRYRELAELAARDELNADGVLELANVASGLSHDDKTVAKHVARMRDRNVFANQAEQLSALRAALEKLSKERKAIAEAREKALQPFDEKLAETENEYARLQRDVGLAEDSARQRDAMQDQVNAIFGTSLRVG